MRFLHLATAGTLSLIGTSLATEPARAAPLPPAASRHVAHSSIVLAGDREAAAVAGAIVGGAVGALLGADARPSPPPPVVVEEEEPSERVIVRRPARRVVEIEEEEPAPRVVQEEECVTRRTRVYDPSSGETVVRKERSCR